MSNVQPQRKNGLENATRMFQANKINPEGGRSIRDLASSTADSINTAEKVSSIMGRKRWWKLYFKILKLKFDHRFSFRNVADVALLYAGSTRGKLDQISLILFPVSFLLFTIIYWILYLSESRKHAQLWLALRHPRNLLLKIHKKLHFNSLSPSKTPFSTLFLWISYYLSGIVMPWEGLRRSSKILVVLRAKRHLRLFYS